MHRAGLREVLIALLVLKLVFGLSQDPTFSQFYTAGLYLNPAAIALEETATLNVHSRTQWKEVGANFQTNQVSLIVPISRKESIEGFWGGIGVSGYQDKSLNGVLNNSGFNASFSTNVKVSGKSQVTLGLQGGMIQKNVNLSNFKWTSQYNPFIGYDPTLSSGVEGISNNVFIPDVSAGVLYYYNYNEDFNDSKMDGFVGLSAYHLNQPNESLGSSKVSKLPVAYKLHAGMDINIGLKVNLSPNLLMVMQADNMQINSGLYMSYLFTPLVERWNPAFVMLGGWYRLQDSFIISAGIGGTYYSIAFSYDMNSSSLKQLAGNVSAYEISLKLKKPDRKMKSHHTPRM